MDVEHRGRPTVSDWLAVGSVETAVLYLTSAAFGGSRTWRGSWARWAAEGQAGAWRTLESLHPFVWCQRAETSLLLATTTPRGRVPASPSRVRPLFLMCLLVDAVEIRNRRLLSATYAAVGERATHESVADVSRTLLLEETPGAFCPRDLFWLLDEVHPTSLFFPRGQRYIGKQTLAPRGVDRGYYCTHNTYQVF